MTGLGVVRFVQNTKTLLIYRIFKSSISQTKYKGKPLRIRNMSLKGVHHILITYPPEAGNATLNFYSQVLGLEKIPRPEASRNVAGAWYALGQIQIHLGEEQNPNNQASRRHICFQVDDLSAFEEHLKAYGVEILPDHSPVPQYRRFFLRDPAGNRLEIIEFVGSQLENTELNYLGESLTIPSTRV